VDFVRMMLPRDWPADRRFDLMLFSEVLYFLDAPDVRLVARRASETLAAHGSVLLVNWTGDTDTPTTGDTAADAFIAASGLAVTRQSRAPGYRLDLLRR
jgi:chemotaxis methyl-accepting protein methylase